MHRDGEVHRNCLHDKVVLITMKNCGDAANHSRSWFLDFGFITMMVSVVTSSNKDLERIEVKS